MNKNQSTGIVVIVAIILIALLSIAFEGPTTATSEISYTQFLNKVQMNKIESVMISGNTITATPKQEAIEKKEQEKTPANPFGLSKVQQTPKEQFKVQIIENDNNLYNLSILNSFSVITST